MIGKALRLMVVGIPNVGKSSFINRMAKTKKTKVGDKPGVTRGKQWVSIDKDVELLDMPGILWPKFDDQTLVLWFVFFVVFFVVVLVSQGRKKMMLWTRKRLQGRWGRF